MSRFFRRNARAYEQRSGFRVRARDLVEDGENPGLMVHRRDVDEDHPQKYPVEFLRDGAQFRIHDVEPKTERIVVLIGYAGDADDLGGCTRIQLPSLHFQPFRVTVTATNIVEIISRDLPIVVGDFECHTAPVFGSNPTGGG